MKRSDIEKQVIEKYQMDEKMMILVFAQWCINHELDPVAVYEEAYPNQKKNDALLEALELTVPKKESEEISDAAVLEMLQLFGNDDLAFVIQEKINQRN